MRERERQDCRSNLPGHLHHRPCSPSASRSPSSSPSSSSLSAPLPSSSSRLSSDPRHREGPSPSDHPHQHHRGRQHHHRVTTVTSNIITIASSSGIVTIIDHHHHNYDLYHRGNRMIGCLSAAAVVRVPSQGNFNHTNKDCLGMRSKQFNTATQETLGLSCSLRGFETPHPKP